ncbi:MAG: hypothetical protein AAFQ32_04660 [Pseudomonadota bacterium]
MQVDIEQLTKSVTSRLTGKQVGSASGGGKERRKLREGLADQLGITDISGNVGSNAAVVAVHNDAPDVVVKVVPEHDHFVCFAYAVQQGHIKSKHFPAVYSITKVDDQYVVLVERIHDEVGAYEYRTEVRHVVERLLGDGRTSLVKASMMLAKWVGTWSVIDHHSGNFRKRKDGTLVFIDPVWSGERSGPDCLEKYKASHHA